MSGVSGAAPEGPSQGAAGAGCVGWQTGAWPSASPVLASLPGARKDAITEDGHPRTAELAGGAAGRARPPRGPTLPRPQKPGAHAPGPPYVANDSDGGARRKWFKGEAMPLTREGGHGPTGWARAAKPALRGRPRRHGASSYRRDLARKGARVGVWLTAGEKNSSAAGLTQSWTSGTVSGGSRPSRVSCRSKGERQQIEKSARSVFADGQDNRRRW